MNRRRFLKSSMIAAGAMSLDLPAFAEKVKTFGDARLCIGILSDIHICNEDSVRAFRHALEYFRDRKVDGVMIAGDMADWGWESQLRAVAETWFSVFPKDKLPDGSKVERLFVYGNHDMGSHGDDEKSKAETIKPRRDKVWKKYFKENFSPVYLKTVKGYHFIGSHWHSQEDSPEAVKFLNENAALLQGEKPFFYFQHAHPKNTVFGRWAWGQDNGNVTRALSAYPNAVAFSGHSHMPLNDDRDLWQGAFTSIGTSSLSYVYLLGGRENSKLDGEDRDLPSQMPVMSTGHGKQGMVMTVYDDAICIERREFVYDQPVADNWVLPLPLLKGEPLSFENRAKKAPIPQFADDAKVTVREIKGKDRYGKETEQVEVSFPSILKKHNGVRANDYEIQVEQMYVDVVSIQLTKRVFSPGYFLGEDQDEKPVVCLFAKEELPSAYDYRFVVRPCECYGGKGRAIRSEIIKTTQNVPAWG